MLELQHVSAFYLDPSVLAIRGVSMRVAGGETVAILGGNGAGKSTILKAIVRQAKVAGGEIRFEGLSLRDIPPHHVCGRGIAYVPEGQRVWPNLTVEENLRLGAFSRTDHKAVERDLAWVYATFERLPALCRRRAYALSGGERQMVAIGRALMGAPRCLLMDEPSLGLAPPVAEEILALVAGVVRERNLPVLVVEQNWALALRVAQRICVMALGEMVYEGSVDSIDIEGVLLPLLSASREMARRAPDGNGQGL